MQDACHFVAQYDEYTIETLCRNEYAHKVIALFVSHVL